MEKSVLSLSVVVCFWVGHSDKKEEKRHNNAIRKTRRRKMKENETKVSLFYAYSVTASHRVVATYTHDTYNGLAAMAAAMAAAAAAA